MALADKARVQNGIDYWSQPDYGMKKEYREQITNKLNSM